MATVGHQILYVTEGLKGFTVPSVFVHLSCPFVVLSLLKLFMR